MKPPPTKPAYPDDTPGSRAARKARALSNRLTDEEREALLAEALAKIHAGATTPPGARARH
jgi:hypothetical protein